MSLAGANDREKLTALCKKTYKEQAVWFLNASWDNGSGNAETLWDYVHKCQELDSQKRAEGSEVDEMNMHRFLEYFKNQKTVRELRDELRKVGVDNFKFIPLTMFLIWHHSFDWHSLVNAPQADNAKEIALATKMLEESQAACDEANRLASEAAKTEATAKTRAAEAATSEAAAKRTAAEAADSEAAAKARAAEAAAALAEVSRADEELSAALGELKAQEDAFNNKADDLKKKSEEGSTVQKSKAANELAQHLASDPLPLRKAKTTTEAAKRKSEKARNAAEDATAKATASANAAEQARKAADESAKDAEKARHAAESAAAEAERAREAAEAQLEEARSKLAEAEAYLEEQKKHTGAGQGSIWWLERELQEQKKYMPQSKGGVARKK